MAAIINRFGSRKSLGGEKDGQGGTQNQKLYRAHFSINLGEHARSFRSLQPAGGGECFGLVVSQAVDYYSL